MAHFQDLSIDDLYLAYRKAKVEAFYEKTHFHALAFTEYETRLDRNLRQLLARLRADTWSSDQALVAGFSYAPKSVSPPDDNHDDGLFYRFLDPLEEWNRVWPNARGERADARFRLVITPTVEFQIISALWILQVGHIYDGILDPTVCFANRVRRRRPELDQVLGEVNVDCTGLFPPYFSGYKEWRERGLSAMRESLKEGKRILAITMDLRSFYHRVSPNFLIHPDFLERHGIRLSEENFAFTKSLVNAIHLWYRSTPDFFTRPEGALPVGLSASKVAANVLLAELDQKILRNLKPLYYGRYIDDVFLVLKSDQVVDEGKAVMETLVRAIPDLLRFEMPPTKDGPQLRVLFPYAQDSEIAFAGKKQKIFNLAGRHGLDLVTQIDAQIRLHSSEHRLLPTVPSTGVEMAARALLAQSNASLEADAIRKADVVAVRRLGLSLLLRDVEAYARDLQPKVWRTRRREFYGLIERHVLTPTGFFDFFAYTHRVFSLMIACGDFEEAIHLLRRLTEVISVLERTTTAGSDNAQEFKACRSFYAHALNQVILQATTVAGFRWSRRILQLFNILHLVAPQVVTPDRIDSAKRLSRQILHSDWGRRSYREAWLDGGQRKIPNPPVPSSPSLRRMFRLGAIRAFRRIAELRLPYWPALIFPTRPLSLAEMTLAAPSLLEKPFQLRSALFAFRGARARNHEGVISIRSSDENPNSEILVDRRRSSSYRVAIPSFLTTHEEWDAAVDGVPKLTLQRYERLRRLINRILREGPNIDYIVFPECSVPFHWARSIAVKLADRKVSFIAGLEYQLTSKGVRNDAFLSLATEWPWHATSVLFRQPKGAPAHGERRALFKRGRRKLYNPLAHQKHPPVYVHGGLCFSVLLCSDLTNISHRGRLQGAIDTLFVLEWNKDLETFGALVEATANDLHSYVVQSNNRLYGDSRIRVPHDEDFQRDVVRVRGGLNDYFVIAALDILSLRQFQASSPGGPDGPYKPVSIGYVMSERRKPAVS